MSVKLLEAGLKLIENEPGTFFKGKISEEIIEKAEKFLDLTFPTSYRLFLSIKGCGSFKYKEFYGIVGDDFENGRIPNAIWLTQDERKSFNLDKNLLLIAQSIEGYYALNTATMKDGECEVVDWIPNPNIYNLEIIAPDFGTFFFNEIKEVLENESL